MSDRQKFLAALRLAGSRGLHSHEVRRQGLSGHPSERARELEHQDYEIHRETEYINGRNGVRFYLLSEPEAKSTAGVSAGEMAPRQGESLRRVPENRSASPDPGGADAQPTGTPVSQEPGSDTNPAVPSAREGDDSPEGKTGPSGEGRQPNFGTVCLPGCEPPPSAFDPYSEAA